jgi:ABC-type methionine transport system ATPase subunit
VPDRIAVFMQGVVREVRSGGNAGSKRVRLLDSVDLTVASGAFLNIVGPSGSGKSSLIRLVNRLDEATGGRVEVLGKPITEWPVRELRRRVGMAFQEPSLLGMIVRDNLRLPFQLCGDTPDDIEDRMSESLEDAEVPDAWLDRDDSQLSVGQKQRVALARALISRPDVLLLDEPTSSLDPRTAERLLDRLVRIRERRHLTMMMVTHRLSEASRMGGDLAVLIDGRVDSIGPVDGIIANPPTEASGRFLHGDDHDTR